ncbi:hypothetical protein [Thiohalobacter sp. COW1]|uniref:hypothetical protein n=1 Tax=Thiohalobacter sp. COW1 TaxID=2795687 RepID=UPI001916041A|nr:hypothetical protein [Thiohalobacter sp. COW1]
MRMFNYLKQGLLIAVCALLPFAASVQAADKFKPFVLAERGPGDMEEKVAEVKESLRDAGFEVVGDYVPFEDSHVIIFTSDAIKSVAALTEYGGFAMAQRAAVVKVGNELQVSYVNPVYMAHAYRLRSDFSNTSEALAQALGRIQEFGSEDGLSERKLRKYHYTFGMEYFPDVYELAEHSSHRAAVAAVEKNLQKDDGVEPLYRIDMPGKDVTIIGVSMAAGEDGDKYMDDAFQMSVVDFGELKNSAYLPYEIMITGNKVVALHMRFRMAVHFPDLKMMGSNSFMKLMPSPAAIEKALKDAVNE